MVGSEGKRDSPTSGAGKREGELLSRAQRGDRDAFVQLVEPYRDRVYSALMRLLGNGDDAAEVIQEALLRTFWKVTGFHRRSHFYTWFYRIAINLAYRRLSVRRRESQRSPAPSDAENPDFSGGLEVISTALSPREEASRHETIRLVRQALSQLKVSDFEILALRELEGFSYEQLARQLEIPPGTVMSRLHRARLALAKQMAKLGIGE